MASVPGWPQGCVTPSSMTHVCTCQLPAARELLPTCPCRCQRNTVRAGRRPREHSARTSMVLSPRSLPQCEWMQKTSSGSSALGGEEAGPGLPAQAAPECDSHPRASSTPFTHEEPEPESKQGLRSECLPSYSLLAKSRAPTHCSVTFSSTGICSL